MRTAALRGLHIPHGQQHSQIVLLAQIKVVDVVTPPVPWTTTGPLSRGCNQHHWAVGATSKICHVNLSWVILVTCLNQGRRQRAGQ